MDAPAGNSLGSASKSPKEVAFPVVEIVINSILLPKPPLVGPPKKIPRVLDATVQILAAYEPS